MNLGAFHTSRGALAALLICFSLVLLGLCGAMAQTQSQPQTQTQASTQPQAQSGSGSSTSTPADDAAAKAAERKRKFDEQRKLMEGGYSPSKEESRHSDPTLRLSPGDLNLLVGDRVQFHLYDKGEEIGNGSWSAGPGWVVASWFNHGIFTIQAKGPGTARVGAMIGSRSTGVMVRVYAGDKMPKGVERSPEAIKPSGSN